MLSVALPVFLCLFVAFSAWIIQNWFWALMTEFSYWGELRKLPSHARDIPADVLPIDCRILQILPGGTGSSTGQRVWVVEQGLILKFSDWRVSLAGRILGTLRIARSGCEVDLSRSDRVIVWMKVGPAAHPPIRVGVELLRSEANQIHVEMLDRWAEDAVLGML
jgi:hypothetical protein